MRAAIAGAGLVGRVPDLELLDRGWQVTLFENEAMDPDCAALLAG